MHTRTDRQIAAKLDTALCLADSDGAHAAAVSLREYGVPLDLAVRVLLKPWLRRSTSARPEPSSRGAPRTQRTDAADR